MNDAKPAPAPVGNRVQLPIESRPPARRRGSSTAYSPARNTFAQASSGTLMAADALAAGRRAEQHVNDSGNRAAAASDPSASLEAQIATTCGPASIVAQASIRPRGSSPSACRQATVGGSQ